MGNHERDPIQSEEETEEASDDDPRLVALADRHRE